MLNAAPRISRSMPPAAAKAAAGTQAGIAARAFPLLVLLLSLGMTLAVFQYDRHRSRLEQQTQIARDAALIGAELRVALERPAQQLRAIQALHATQDAVSESEWRLFTRRLHLNRPLPGVVAYGYAPRRDRHAEGSAAPSLPIRHVAPAGALPLALDLSADPSRAAAIDRARDYDGIVLSRRLTLGELLGTEESAGGLLLVLPIYDRSRAIETVADRRRAFAGVAFAVIRIDALLAGLHHARENALALRVLDDESFNSPDADAAPRLLHDPGVDGHVVERREMEFGQRNWQLQFVSAGHAPPPRESIALLIAGLTISILLGAAARAQTWHRERAERLAVDMTRELRLSEERFKLAAEGASEGLWDHDLVRGTLWHSERLKAMLGHPGDADVDRPERFLACVHPDDRAKLDAALAEHFSEDRPYRVEYRFRRGDGEWIWLSSHAQGVRDDAGRPLRLVGSTSDITERRLAEAELLRHRDRLQEMVEERTADLMRAKETAEQASEAKSAALANMSHELRTPLHSVLSFAALGSQRAHAAQQEKLAHYFERIQQSGSRLLALVNDLLDLAKLEAGKMRIVPSVQDALPIVRETLAEFEPMAGERGVRLEIDAAAQNTRAAVDAGRLAQVIRNMVSNAVKFSPAGGRVRVELTDARLARGRRATDVGDVAALQIAVHDAGPGIPEGELESIFEKFVQSSWTSTGAGGTGLGLSICREIMREHRGSIGACNNPDGGASFSIVLPREMPPPHRGNRQ